MRATPMAILTYDASASLLLALPSLVPSAYVTVKIPTKINQRSLDLDFGSVGEGGDLS